MTSSGTRGMLRLTPIHLALHGIGSGWFHILTTAFVRVIRSPKDLRPALPRAERERFDVSHPLSRLTGALDVGSKHRGGRVKETDGSDLTQRPAIAVLRIASQR